MRRTHLLEPRKVVLEEVPDPSPGPGEVRLAVETCGVCGSDIHAYLGHHPFMVPPLQPGHEFAGKIDEVGEGVTDWQVGQRVATEPSLNCQKCPPCLDGRYHICSELRVIGAAAPGAMADYVVVPSRKLIALPDELSFEQGAFLEPLAVGVHAIARTEVGPDTRLLILGSGTIGLMTLFAALAKGVREITVTDLVEDKLTLARKLGARHTVNASKTQLGEFCLTTYGEEMAFDAAAECVGTESTVRDGLPILRRGGKMIIVGVFPNDVSAPIGLLQDREIDLLGSLMYQIRDFKTARDLMASGLAPVERLISARYPLTEIVEAFQKIESQPETNTKTMIHVRPQCEQPTVSLDDSTNDEA